ncbi:hypothetical protein K504DRAFT_458251 [Pleomassaria siparia CBS 279.74]|uniref:Uncharacterized protein n=1 Tax=Pleomassaria siparia CBS 279.74 TaxID=1314801 RepID=A0A6G1K5W9_9PLEO|nr:hypothetical protein K504DRAFT_458251 [Pleomassaria siparia CBS 279.74]
MALATRNPALAEKISQMRLNIAPIVHVKSGNPPPQFPSTMLELFLLTEDQLDAMARYYSQITPSVLTYSYPQTMDWNRPFLTRPQEGDNVPEGCGFSDYERLRIKMRMFAKFCGFQGAETPTWEYERQFEILRARIDRTIEEEERVLEAACKFFPGSTLP